MTNVLTVTNTTASNYRVEEGGAEDWVEVIPSGQYASGTFTIPNSKTWGDIAEITVVALVNGVHHSTYIPLLQPLFTNNWKVGAGSATDYGRIAVPSNSPAATNVTVSRLGNSSYINTAYVKFK